MSILPVGIGPQEGGYQIERSLRFNSADSAYLNRTPASAGNRKTWTWSGWVKRSALSSSESQSLFTAGPSGSDFALVFSGNDAAVGADNSLSFYQYVGSFAWQKTTSQLFRDVSAWYHILAVLDTDNATAEDRARIYVNGSRVTSWQISSNPSSGYSSTQVNNTTAHKIGESTATNTRRFNGYLTEVNFIDGQALDPTSFGEYNSETGVWQPKAYTGSYGTNGFYLDFADNSSTTALGYDAAGSNDWTPNNFSVTAGSGNDSLVDTPTPYGTDTGVGGEVRGNYATLNPLDNGGNTLSNGNLDYVGNGDTTRVTRSTFAMPTSGKWYVECRINSLASNGLPNFGIVSGSQALTGSYTGTTLQIRPKGADSNYPYWVIDSDDASKRVNTTPVVAGTIIQLIYDADLGKVWMGVNNTYYGISSGSTVTVSSSDIANGTNPAYTLNSAITYFTCIIGYTSSDAASVNFGQRPFAYTAPSGFKALCTQNLPEPTIADGSAYMNALTYTGTGASNSLTGVGFQPDLVWVKDRSNVRNHYLWDSVRGSLKELYSNLTNAESTNTIGLSSFDSDGFTLNNGDNAWNGSGNSYVAWNWKAGGSGVSNTDGSITSTVSANTTAGFSIVTYNSGTSGNKTVGHGLGVKPAMIITKSRTSASYNWSVYHTSIASTVNKYLQLNTTAATSDNGSSIWGASLSDTNSTTFGINSGNGVVASTDCIAYVFAPVESYSAFGSFVGNGSSTDGPFIFTGFRPKFILAKKTSATSNWSILDTARDGYNVADNPLLPNSSAAESTSTSTSGAIADILSNGFKVRGNSGDINDSGATYIYAAFAEVPMKFALGR